MAKKAISITLDEKIIYKIDEISKAGKSKFINYILVEWLAERNYIDEEEKINLI